MMRVARISPPVSAGSRDEVEGQAALHEVAEGLGQHAGDDDGDAAWRGRRRSGPRRGTARSGPCGWPPSLALRTPTSTARREARAVISVTKLMPHDDHDQRAHGSDRHARSRGCRSA